MKRPLMPGVAIVTRGRYKNRLVIYHKDVAKKTGLCSTNVTFNSHLLEYDHYNPKMIRILKKYLINIEITSYPYE